MHTPVFHFLAGFAGRNEVMILKNEWIYDIVRSRNFTKRREYDEIIKIISSYFIYDFLYIFRGVLIVMVPPMNFTESIN